MLIYSFGFPSRLRRRILKFGKDPPFEILSIERFIKFPLDKRVYILETEYERIRTLRQEAIERGEQPTDPRIPTVDKDAA